MTLWEPSQGTCVEKRKKTRGREGNSTRVAGGGLRLADVGAAGCDAEEGERVGRSVVERG